jgi:hypothetical protein
MSHGNESGSPARTGHPDTVDVRKFAGWAKRGAISLTIIGVLIACTLLWIIPEDGLHSAHIIAPTAEAPVQADRAAPPKSALLCGQENPAPSYTPVKAAPGSVTRVYILPCSTIYWLEDLPAVQSAVKCHDISSGEWKGFGECTHEDYEEVDNSNGDNEIIMHYRLQPV